MLTSKTRNQFLILYLLSIVRCLYSSNTILTSPLAQVSGLSPRVLQTGAWVLSLQNGVGAMSVKSEVQTKFHVTGHLPFF